MLLTPLYDKPNTVLQKQRAYQNDHRAIYRRLPRSNIYLTMYGTTFIVGMLATSYGLVSLIKGKQAE